MPSIDGIKPPIKKDVAAKKITNKTETDKPKVKKQEIIKSVIKTSSSENKKRSYMWYMVGLVAIIIFLAWIFIFQNSLSIDDSNSDSLSKIKASITELWDTVKEDILKIKTQANSNTNNVNVNNEVIKELEEKVFPQFDDPNRQ